MASLDLAKHLQRVHMHASLMARRVPAHIQMDDLVSAGYLGLVEALARCDWSRTQDLYAYADHRIRGAIQDELRRHECLTRDQRAFTRRMEQASRRLTARLGRPPGERELARSLRTSLRDLRTQRRRMQETEARRTAGVYEEHLHPGPPPAPIEDRLWLGQIARELPMRHRKVLKRYYQLGWTLREIGAAYGVTESRACQIHREAIDRLRAALETTDA